MQYVLDFTIFKETRIKSHLIHQCPFSTLSVSVELAGYHTKRIRKNNDYLQESKWLSKCPRSFYYWTDVGVGGKQVTSLDIEGKEGFSSIKRVDIYWAYCMSGTVGCISDLLSNLNIKTLWDRFYYSNYFYLWEMRHNFPTCEKCLKHLLSSRVYHLQGSLEKIWIWERRPSTGWMYVSVPVTTWV